MKNPDHDHLYPATILGNGRSRLAIDLDQVHAKTITYGCNAIHRDFATDYLIALDAGIVFEIIDANSHLKSRFYTQTQRRLDDRMQNDTQLRKHINIIPPAIKLSDSGNTAIKLACLNKHKTVYLVGFDYGVMPDKPKEYNNVYRSTTHYLPIANNQVNLANGKSWKLRMQETLRAYPTIEFKRVVYNCESVHTKQTNYKEITVEQFKEEINQL